MAVTSSRRLHVMPLTSPSPPDIGPHHLGMVLHLVRRAERDDLAVVQRHHAVGHHAHQVHVVLDHDHRDAEVLLDVLDPEPHALGLLDIQAGGRFVQQQQLRLDAQRAAEFDHLAHAIGQVGDQRVAIALKAEEGDHLLGLLAMLQFRAAHRWQEDKLRQNANGRMAVPADQQVLQQRGVGEQLDVLERARDAEAGDPVRRDVGDVLVLEDQPARRRLIDAADQVEDRRLAGAVRADDREHLALLHLEADRIHGADAAEADRDVVGARTGSSQPLRARIGSSAGGSWRGASADRPGTSA